MRILITAGIFPPEIGGPAKYVPEIAEALVNKGHQVTVVAPKNPRLSSSIQKPVYRLVQFPHACYVRYLNFIIELERAFLTIFHEAKNCDIIYCNGLEFPSMWVSQLTHKPLVIKIVGDRAWELLNTRRKTILNLDEFQSSKYLSHRLLKYIIHQGIKKANAIIVPSQYLLRIVENWGIERKNIQVIYNALKENTQYLERSSNLNYSLGFSSGIRLVTSGRLLPHKNIDEIIKILPSIPMANLVIIGDGPQRNQLQKLVFDLELQNRVALVGILNQTAIYELLSKCDIFILNSTYEGFPHVLLEAAANSLPIIATSVGGTVEFIQNGETGLLIPPHNSKELINAIEILSENYKLRQSLVQNARKRLELFSYDRMVSDTEVIIIETQLQYINQNSSI